MATSMYTIRQRMVGFLSVVLCIGTLFAGCGNTQPDQHETGAKTTQTEAPAEITVEESAVTKTFGAEQIASILAQVKASTSLIELYEATVDLKSTKMLPTDISEAMSERHTVLLAEAEVVDYGDGLKLLDVDFRRAGAEECEVLLLFLPKEKIQEQVKIGLAGYVDKSHASYLSSEAEVDKLRENWRFWPTPRAPEWVPGEEVLIRTTVKAGPIPYSLRMGLYLAGSGRIGEYTELGWHAALDEE